MSCGVIEATAHVYRRIAELLTTYSSLVTPRHLPKGERLTLLPAD